MTDGTRDVDDAGGASLEGLEAQVALDRIRERRPERDPDELRRALDYAVRDGIVTTAALEAAIADRSKLLATAETRVELARSALADARETAASAPDLRIVAGRLDSFERATAALEERAVDLGPSFTAVVDARSEGVEFSVLDDLRRVESRARDVQLAADDLQVDLEAFERWLTDHETRVSELAADVDALEAALDDLEATVDSVSTAEDPARRWFDATLRHRTTALTVADLRRELTDLRTWADSHAVEATEDGSLDDFAARIDDCEARRESLETHLEERAAPAWHDRFGDRLDAFETDVEDQTPPVDWAVVQDALERRLPDGEDECA